MVAASVTVVSTAMLWLEHLTNGWFLSLRVMGVAMLGGGDVARLVPIVFLGGLAALTFGALTGGMWLRFGYRGLWTFAIAAMIGIALLFWGAAPLLPGLIGSFGWPHAYLTMCVLALICAIGTWAVMRGVIVRRA